MSSTTSVSGEKTLRVQGTGLFIISTLANDDIMKSITKMVFVKPIRNTINTPDNHPPDLTKRPANMIIFENDGANLKMLTNIIPVDPEGKSPLTEWGLIDIFYVNESVKAKIADIINKNPNSLKSYEDDTTSTTAEVEDIAKNTLAKNKEEIEEKKAEIEEREAELAKREANVEKKLAAPPPEPVASPPPEPVASPPPEPVAPPPPPPPAKKPLTIKKVSGVTEHDPVRNPNGSYKAIVTNHSGQSYSVEAKSLDEVQNKMNALNKKGENRGPYINDGYSNNINNSGGGRKSKTKRLLKKRKIP